MSMFKWEVVHGGKTPPPGASVGPMQRLSWGRTAGLGAQHVVAMFGATFVFPIVMGLDANLAIMFSGICTILFLLICQNRVPSYLGTSASFVAGVAAIRAQGGDSADVTGAIFVAGVVLALVGVAVHFGGSSLIHRVLPPAVTGAVVMLIGFNLAPVVAGIYWPQDQWIALLTAAFMVCAAVLLPGFWSRIAVFLALIFGYVVSFAADAVFGPITSVTPVSGGEAVDARPGTAGPPSRRPTGSASRGRAGRRRLGRARTELLPDLHPAGAARRHRPDRREHRAREGSRRDDRAMPRPLPTYKTTNEKKKKNNNNNNKQKQNKILTWHSQLLALVVDSQRQGNKPDRAICDDGHRKRRRETEIEAAPWGLRRDRCRSAPTTPSPHEPGDDQCRKSGERGSLVSSKIASTGKD